MVTCKDCLHNGLCKDMHTFGIIDLPHDDDRAICEHFKATADVVEVVRCKDCKYLSFDQEVGNICKLTDCFVLSNGFCSYGERKET